MNTTYRLWPGWYRGDFHAHTFRSDGSLSPRELLAEAEASGLDFFSITDHNVTTAFDEFGEHPNMLIIRGVEVTMKYGHFNVFGLSDPNPAWLRGLPQSRADYEHHMQTGAAQYTPTELMKLTKSQGLYNSINHPMLSVWKWLDMETDLQYVDFIEIWNDPSWYENVDFGTAEAVALWTNMLNGGHRITAIGGTDLHHNRPHTSSDGTIIPELHLNEPTTHVYAQNLSHDGIMNGLKARNAYVSLGPTVAFGGTHHDKAYKMGSDLGTVNGTLTIQGSVKHDGDMVMQLVKNGDVLMSASGNGQLSINVPIALDSAESAWFRLDVFDADNNHLAVTNPIFTGPALPITSNRYGDFLP